ncbi:type VII secretion-associated serine protease mycosin [Actinophytocola sp.]|uniref:type VII secretion-associated serine protease mycosin n=1 Tax=Actinophytocola sp. TaxID=1872138 RepID=UPI002D6C2040|nr:type VII secretion-associated serine protease mycosin [Actinophytocola sp.]HYQ61627.1 type VII secretion-associated serine protease mycosin [Actinophytocola sp.]
MAVSRTNRVVSVLAATLLAFAPAVPAAAQPTSSSQPPSSASSSSAPPSTTAPAANMAAPPPLPADYPLPNDDGKPDREYTQKTQCVQSRDSQPLKTKPWGQDLLRFDEIARFGVTGAGQRVAVIDTGVFPHPYLAGRLTGGGDYVKQDNNGLEDCDGHGTEVAGIIAAKPTDPGIGFRGIAPDAEIVSIRQSSSNYEFKDQASNQTFTAGNLTTLAKAIIRAANAGVTVINMSVDSCRPTSAGPITEPEKGVQAALRYAVEQKNIVVVASAGNIPESDCTEQNNADPQNPTWLVIPPWFSEYVLSVAAVRRDGQVAPFSFNGPWVSVAAPGTEITSLAPASTTGGLATQQYDDKGNASPIQGTSFAAPYVAGLAALVREKYPNLTAKQVMNRIKTTAAHPAASGGHDSLVGYGMINPVAALTAFIPSEKGIAPDKAVDEPFRMPPPDTRDWTPMRVAMIGSGGGVGVLLLTLFVVHTVRRNRREEEEPGPRHL